MPALLLLPYTYQLLRWVLIPPLSCLYLPVHTELKPACSHSINGISQLLHSLVLMSVLFFSRLKLNKFSYMFQFGLAEKGKTGGWKTGVCLAPWSSSHSSSPPPPADQSQYFLVLFCAVAPLSWSQTARQPVARLTRERLVILLSYASERKRGRENEKQRGRAPASGREGGWEGETALLIFMYKARQTLKGQSYTINDTHSLSY